MEHYQNRRNPVLPPHIHIPDGEAHVMPDGKLYIYGSYDGLPDRYCSDRYYVVSTEDLANWLISEVSFRGSQVPWNHDSVPGKRLPIDASGITPFLKSSWKVFLKQYLWANRKRRQTGKSPPRPVDPKELLFAPDCMEKDGRYYLYFCLSDGSEGVAVADNPDGPFHSPVQLSAYGIDPAVFMDADGSAYYYWGQFASHGVKLGEDMQSFDPEGVVDNLLTEQEHFFHEGSSLRKIGDTYYCVYADMERGRPTSLGYATSQSPLGPFTYRGIIIDNALCDPESWNIHGSIECFLGQWYVFYHRSSRGTHLYRRLCVEPIEILSDGSIPEVKMTSQGAGKPFGPGELIQGYHACQLMGKLYIDADERYGEKLCHIRAKDQAVFRYVTNDRDYTAIQIHASGEGWVDVYLDDRFAGSVDLRKGAPAVGSIQAPAGTWELRLQFRRAQNLEVYSLILT